MSLLSEITIKPGNSKVYARLLFILNVITGALIIHAPINHAIQWALCIFLLGYNLYDFKNKNPCKDIQELRLIKNQCIVLSSNGQIQNYDKVAILIHNEIFQLIKLKSSEKNKILVLFNDQISNEQLRLLHVRAGMKEKKARKRQ